MKKQIIVVVALCMSYLMVACEDHDTFIYNMTEKEDLRLTGGGLDVTTIVDSESQGVDDACGGEDIYEDLGIVPEVLEVAQAEVVDNHCSGSVLHVPQDCETIQEAVDNAEFVEYWGMYPTPLTTILISSGVYYENVVISTSANLMIAAADEGEVVIDGGAGCALATETDGGVSVALWNLTLVSAQPSPYFDYRAATVFMEYCDLLQLNSVEIHTQTIGLTINYSADVEVIGSKFIGDGSEQSVGIGWNHVNSGGRVFDSTFQKLGIAITQCSGADPELSALYDYDSNVYEGVGLPYYFDASCP